MNLLKTTPSVGPILLFALVLGALVYIARAAESPGSGVIHIDHEKVAAAFANGSRLIATNNFKIQTGRREMGGEVEVHEEDTDTFYILEGSATFITGGKVVQPRMVSAGETRAKEIVGGEEHKLVKGDVIVIPKRVPHWFKEVHGLLLYYVVKVSN